MTYSHTRTESSTFTITHARELASRVSADLHLCARYYGGPSESGIRDYLEELAQLLKGGYVSEYEFGFERNGKRVVSVHYTVDDYGVLTTNDSPGKVFARADVKGASFYNYMWRSAKWQALTQPQRDRIEAGLPFKRTAGAAPTDGDGYWTTDKNYHSGGKSLSRATFRPF